MLYSLPQPPCFHMHPHAVNIQPNSYPTARGSDRSWIEATGYQGSNPGTLFSMLFMASFPLTCAMTSNPVSLIQLLQSNTYSHTHGSQIRNYTGAHTTFCTPTQHPDFTIRRIYRISLSAFESIQTHLAFVAVLACSSVHC